MKLKINDSKINWENSDSHYLFNPKDPKALSLKKLAKKIPFLKGHIYLLTSSSERVCLLSKNSFLVSAQAVNKNLQAEKKDRWLIPLPLFHVAGLSVLARSFCGGFSFHLYSQAWNPRHFKKKLEEEKISLSSLVPAQIHDLSQKELKAPKSLRAVIVGGGALSPKLYKKAKSLGWPLLISYGLTEACSQVACSGLASLNKKAFPRMKLLDHIKIKKNREKIKISSGSLFTAYFDREKNKFYDPKDKKGWWELPDHILIKKNAVFVQGRKEEEVKILGEKVSLQKLQLIVEKWPHKETEEFYLLAIPDARDGKKIALVTNCFDLLKIQTLIKKFNTKVFPFEKIRSIYQVSEIKKTSLFKIRSKIILKQLGFDTDPV